MLVISHHTVFPNSVCNHQFQPRNSYEVFKVVLRLACIISHGYSCCIPKQLRLMKGQSLFPCAIYPTMGQHIQDHDSTLWQGLKSAHSWASHLSSGDSRQMSQNSTQDQRSPCALPLNPAIWSLDFSEANLIIKFRISYNTLKDSLLKSFMSDTDFF